MQDRAEINLCAGRGVTVREFPLKTGFADYLLFVDRRPIGAIEAKAEGIALAGVEPPHVCVSSTGDAGAMG